MKGRIVIVGMLVVFLLSSLGVGFGNNNANSHEIVRLRGVSAAIMIESNQEFKQYAENNSIPGNGTKDNPYILSGYYLDLSNKAYGIYIANTTVYFKIENSEILGASKDGIMLVNVSNAVIYKDNIHNNENTGVHIVNSHNILINKSTLNTNVQECGVNIQNSFNITIISTTIKYNGWHGVYIYNSSKILLDHLSLHNSNYNVEISNSHQITISNSTMTGSSQYGNIEFYESNNSLIYKNNVSNAYSYWYSNANGINLISSNNITVSKNNVYDNYKKGIFLKDSTNNLVLNNTVYSNEYGIYVTGSSSENLIKGNDVYNNYLGGINIYASHNTITNNTVHSTSSYYTQQYGIYISSSSNMVKGNHVFKNDDGIRIYNTKDVTVEYNELDYNTNGVHLTDSSAINVILNNYFKCKIGINVDFNSTGNEIANNTVQNSTRYGIYVTGNAYNNRIENNRITGSTWVAMYIYNAKENKFYRNSMNNNRYNFGVWGTQLENYIQSVDTSNTIDGREILYLLNDENVNITGDYAFVGLVNCMNITVWNKKISHGYQGMLIAFTSNIKLKSNFINNSMYGVFIYKSENINGTEIKAVDSNTMVFADGANSLYLHQNTVENTTGYNITNSTSITVEKDMMKRGNAGVILYGDSSVTINGCKVDSMNYGVFAKNSSAINVNANTFSNDTAGVYVVNVSDVIVLKNNFSNVSKYGTYIDSSSGVKDESNVYLNCSRGVDVEGGYGNRINNNTIFLSTEFGLYIANSTYHNELRNNSISNSSVVGIMIYYANPNTMSMNNMSGNRYNLGIIGNKESHYFQRIDKTNTVDGKEVLYLTNVSGTSISGDYGFIGLVNCSDITFIGRKISNEYEGFLLAYSKNISIGQITINESYYGIFDYNSTEINVYNMSIESVSRGVMSHNSTNGYFEHGNVTNSSYGFFVEGSNWIKIANFTFTYTQNTVIYIKDSGNTSITNNTLLNITKNGVIVLDSENMSLQGNRFTGKNIYVYYQPYHIIDFASSKNITVEYNRIEHIPNVYSEPFYIYKGRDIIVSRNTIKDVLTKGISAKYLSANVTIRDNLFINMTTGIDVESSSNVKIINNTVYNTSMGLYMSGGKYNLVRYNNISHSSEYGIDIHSVSNSLIELNNVSFTNNTYTESVGIYFKGASELEKYYTVIRSNTLWKNRGPGIYLYECGGLKIYDNFFYYNRGSNGTYNSSHVQARIYDASYYNKWYSEGGYGNYWYDWANNNDTNDQNGDGFVDWPYRIKEDLSINAYVSDPYPLKYPIILRDPSAPLNLTLSNYSVNNTYVNLSWKAPISDGGVPIKKYYVYRYYTNGVGGWYSTQRIATVDANQLWYNDTSVSNGYKYFYYVSAVAATESPPSNTVNVIIVNPPDPPKNVKAVAGDGEVTLTWSISSWGGDGAYRKGINIYRNGVFLKKVDSYTTNYVDKNVVNGVNYTYYLTQLNQFFESKPSENVTARPVGKPESPTNLNATVGDGYVNLTWQPPVSDGGYPIKGYNIYKNGVLVVTVSPNQTYYNDTNVVGGQTYTYYVTAINSAGESNPSNEVQATPPGTIPELSAGIWTVIFTLISMILFEKYRKYS